MIQFLIAFTVLTGIQPALADYDESADFSPPYNVNQNDASLEDLFNPANGKSSLCVPTTLANIVADQSAFRNPNFPRLRLVANPSDDDYTQQVRYFAQQCGTDPVNGTIVANAAKCLRNFYRQSGYINGWVYLIGKEANTDPQSVQFFHGPRPLSVDDIRYYVTGHVGVLMDVYWEKEQNSSQQTPPSWAQEGGHTFMVAGYDYNYAWGQTQIQLHLVNPLSTYTQGDSTDHYDEVTMTSVAASPEIAFPAGFTYVLSGPGFDSQTVRGYVRNILVSLPDLSVSPTP